MQKRYFWAKDASCEFPAVTFPPGNKLMWTSSPEAVNHEPPNICCWHSLETWVPEWRCLFQDCEAIYRMNCCVFRPCWLRTIQNSGYNSVFLAHGSEPIDFVLSRLFFPDVAFLRFVVSVFGRIGGLLSQSCGHSAPTEWERQKDSNRWTIFLKFLFFILPPRWNAKSYWGQ